MGKLKSCVRKFSLYRQKNKAIPTTKDVSTSSKKINKKETIDTCSVRQRGSTLNKTTVREGS